MVNERYKKINDFLNYILNIAISNPNFEMTDGAIYGELTRIGVTNYDRYYDVNTNFQYWMDKFATKENINVFCSDRWNYFCQFTNLSDEKCRTNYKLYVPLKSSGILKGTEILFNYLAENDIKHVSKVGSKIRNDDVVIRVYNVEDATKVASFINSNEYIKANLIEPSPFMLSDGNIGYATDADISYSDQVSNYIYGYFCKLDNEQRLNDISAEGLLEYITESYDRVFVKGEKEAVSEYELINKMDGFDMNKKISKMANASEVTKLIIYSLDGTNDLTRVKTVYDELMDEDHMQKVEKHIKSNYLKEYDATKEDETTDFAININKSEILMQAVLETLNKYGYEQAKGALELYAMEGKSNGITSNNGARQNLIAYVTSAEARQIINETCNGISFSLYMNFALNRQALEYKENILQNACFTTLEKYNIGQVRNALRNAITGNFKSFTNNNNVRKTLIENVVPTEIEPLMKDILIKNGIDNNRDIQEQFLSLLQFQMQEYKSNKKNNITL